MSRKSSSTTKDDLAPTPSHAILLEPPRSTAVCLPSDQPRQRPYSETILSPSTLAIDSLGLPKQFGTLTSSRSRRQSTSEMRNGGLTLDNAQPTQTPTGRVSKAKKGRRVHACEFAGCGKVFTRAEHRRRHELNHNPEATYRCPQQACNKTFHRADLLQRHQERHDLDASIQSPLCQIAYPAPPSLVASSNSLGLTSPSRSHDTSRLSNEAISLSSIPQPRTYSAECPSLSFDMSGASYIPNYEALLDQSSHYTESDRSSSPVSNVFRPHLHRSSISSSYHSPLIPGQPWQPSIPTPSLLTPEIFTDSGVAYVPEPMYQCSYVDWMEMSGLQYNKTSQQYLDAYVTTHESGYSIPYDGFL